MRIKFVKTRCFLLTICSLALTGASHAQDTAIAWSPDLKLSSLADIPQKMAEPLNPGQPGLNLSNANGKILRMVTTCNEFLEAVAEDYSPANNLEVKRESWYVQACYALRDLQTARTPMESNLLPDGWSTDALDKLPPLDVFGEQSVVDAAQKAEESGKSWQEYEPSLRVTKIEGDHLEAEDDHGGLYSVDIIARADFTGDGHSGLAIVSCERAVNGTLADYNYYILTSAKNGKGPMRRITARNPPYALTAK
jgi:hypothetical protein